MKIYKTPLKEVLNNDPNNSFWSRIKSNPAYKQTEAEIDYILNQGLKHRKPFDEINPIDLDKK